MSCLDLKRMSWHCSHGGRAYQNKGYGTVVTVEGPIKIKAISGTARVFWLGGTIFRLGKKEV